MHFSNLASFAMFASFIFFFAWSWKIKQTRTAVSWLAAGVNSWMDPISYQPNIEVENSDLEVDMDEVIEK